MQTKICLCVLTSMTLQMTIPSCCSVSFVNLCLNVGLHSLCNWPNIRVSLFRLTENTTNQDSVEKIQSLFFANSLFRAPAEHPNTFNVSSTGVS